MPGKFIAHCNLGLAYQALGQLQEATSNHQHALRYAIRMSSLAGESLACGHLGTRADTLPASSSFPSALASSSSSPSRPGPSHSRSLRVRLTCAACFVRSLGLALCPSLRHARLRGSSSAPLLTRPCCACNLPCDLPSGMLGSADTETSKACTERQLQLAKTLQVL